MKVLHIRTVSGTGGGPDKTIFASCKFLRDSGIGAEAFYILDAKSEYGNFTSLAEKYNIRLFQSFENAPVSLATLGKLRSVLKAGNYDIVHSHDYKSNLLALLFRRTGQFKLVTTVHGYNRTSLREFFYYALDKAVLRFSDAVVTPSNDLAGTILKSGVSRSRLHVIHNGIEVPDRKAHERNDRVRLLYLGRLSSEKDPMNLLRAFSILRDDGLDVELRIAGGGPEKSTLQIMITQKKLDEVVHLLGHITNVSEELQQSDILVNSSRTECMPNSILEAMAWGVPVVATNVGGVSEMLRDEIDGLLCPPGNPAELAEKIKLLATDKILAETLEKSAYNRAAENFSFTRHMEKTMDVYSDIM